jgi:hypothetical protein
MPSPAHQTAPVCDGFYFSFTLRLADDVGLGIDLMPSLESKQSLVVRGILPNGALAAWNLQCFDGTMKQLKAVWPGDAIMEVNGKATCDDMLHQCRTSLLLKITVFRDAPDAAGLHPASMAPAWQCSRLGAVTWLGRAMERLESVKNATIRI